MPALVKPDKRWAPPPSHRRLNPPGLTPTVNLASGGRGIDKDAWALSVQFTRKRQPRACQSAAAATGLPDHAEHR